jgi:Domain of unknown function (DUF4431)
VARRPLDRERVYLDGGRRTTQLMRDSLGSASPRCHLRSACVVLALTFLLPFGLKAQDSTAEPAGVLEGILQEGEFFGPPGYGENPATDQLERSYYLQLPVPLGEQTGFQHLPKDADTDATRVFFVQLVVLDAARLKPRPLIGHRVRVAGHLMAAITGHHRTPVLLVVNSFTLVHKWH